MNLRFWRRTVEPSAREQRDLWLKWLELSGFSPSSIDGYRRLTDKFLARWPELRLSEFTDEHIIGFVEEANAASRQGRRGAFSNLFGWAARTRRVERNPMQFVPTYKATVKPEIECFTEAEQKVLCSLSEPDGTLMALLLGSGMRRTEATNLIVRRVVLENAEILVVEGAKGGNPRIIPISHALVSRLAGYFITEGLNEEDYLFYCQPGGTPRRRHDRAISAGAWDKWWRRCIETAGVRYRKPHTTRHSYATDLRRRGLTNDDVGDLLGHADPKTTKKSMSIHPRLTFAVGWMHSTG